MISVIFPAYNEEENVALLHSKIMSALSTLNEPFEIIAINNASTDRTGEILNTLSPIKIITIAYNLGQTGALDAGIHAAKGDVIVTLDADLQNDPADIPMMYKKFKEGYDAVVGWRKNRHDNLNRKIFSYFANMISRKLLGVKIHDYACALKLFNKRFIEDVRLYGEMHVFLVAILNYRGAKITEIQVNHHERSHGVSKHNFIKGAKDLADLLTIKFILNTSRPLLIFGTIAIYSFALAAISGILAVILKLMELRNLAETPLPVVTSLFIILSFILVMMGFLAELILRTYYESRNSTPYLIKSIVER